MFNCQKVSFNRYIATIVLLNGVLVHDIEEDISQTSNKDVGKLLRKPNKVVGPPCSYQDCLQVRMSQHEHSESINYFNFVIRKRTKIFNIYGIYSKNSLRIDKVSK